ncbi:MAG: PolC-type DNA polymerase III [Bacillota bacterium]
MVARTVAELIDNGSVKAGEPRLRQLLSMAIKRIRVSRREKAWYIELEPRSELSWEDLWLLEEMIGHAHPELKAVFISCQTAATCPNLGEALRIGWERIVRRLCLTHPSLGACLGPLPIVRDENCIELSVNSEMTRLSLMRKGAIDQISDALSQITGRPMTVMVCIQPETNNEQGSVEPRTVVMTPTTGREPSAKPQSTGPTILFGRSIRSQALPIVDVTDERRGVTVAGEVISLEVRDLSTGRQMLTLDLTDYTDSLTVRVFADSEGRRKLHALPSTGQWIKVRGTAQYDQRSGELCLLADDLELLPPPLRRDTADTKRVELHLHTKMSAMDALSDVRALFRRLRDWGHRAVAITDHGVVQAYPEVMAASRQTGVKAIYGVEAYLVDCPVGTDAVSLERIREAQPFHVILLAKNNQGLKNLYRLVSASHVDYFYRVPRVPRGLLDKHREDLLVGSACEAGELFQALLRAEDETRLLEIASYYDYLEIQPLANNDFLVREGTVRQVEALAELNRRVIELGQKTGRPVVATGDVHFLDPHDAVYREVLFAGQGYTDTEFQAPLYLKTTDELLNEFAYLGDELAREVVVDAPNRLADSIGEVEPVPPGTFPPVLPGADEELRWICRERAVELYGDPLPPEVDRRIERELAAIIGHGFAGIFIIARQLVLRSFSDGYLVGSRGSVGSCLVAHLAGITEVNPLPAHYRCPNCRHTQFPSGVAGLSGFDLPPLACPVCGQALVRDGHDIPFEVFMGFEGDKVPDIDLNFSGDYQALAHGAAVELLGADCVYRAGTIATVAEKTAYGFVKAYCENRGKTLRKAEVGRLARGCSGVRRTTGRHPGGLVIVPSNRRIEEFTPVQYPANDTRAGMTTTHFDYDAIHDQLVKLDLLGHDDPTALRMLQDLTGVDPLTIPMDDEATLAIFSGLKSLGIDGDTVGTSVGTLGVPEFGTPFVRGMLESTRPGSFSELVRISGLSHGNGIWIGNADQLIAEGVASLKEVVGARDDIMLYLMDRGIEPAHAFKIMESVRKGKGLRPEDEEAMRRVGVPEWYIGSLRKITYMFPKAHAVAYVTMSFRVAYYKVHYPSAFYATYFTVRADEFDHRMVVGNIGELQEFIDKLERKGLELSAREKSILTILEVAREMYARGFRFAPVDLMRSHATRFAIDGRQLLAPFVAIPGLGNKAAENLMAARAEARFTSTEDLAARAHLNRAVIQLLRDHGVLDGLPETDQLTLF